MIVIKKAGARDVPQTGLVCRGGRQPPHPAPSNYFGISGTSMGQRLGPRIVEYSAQMSSSAAVANIVPVKCVTQVGRKPAGPHAHQRAETIMRCCAQMARKKPGVIPSSARSFAPRFLPALGHPHAVALRFICCDQFAVGLAPTARPCRARQKKQGRIAALWMSI